MSAKSSYLNSVFALLERSGDKTLCEIGNETERPKAVKGKLTAILSDDDRFMINGDVVTLRTGNLKGDDSEGVSTRESPREKPPYIIGDNWENVEFTDQTEWERSIHVDISQTHEFLVRGKNYLADSKKIHTGPAVFRLVVSEFIGLTDEDGDTAGINSRYDHIASMGRIKHRVDAIKSIEHPPEIFVMNYQYPGTPPISHVVIFVADPSVNDILPDDSDDTAAYKKLWSRFKHSICRDEMDRLALHAREQELKARQWGWRWPSDITWASHLDPGVYPHSHYTNMTLKVVPRLLEGNFIVRNAMPSDKPCILGQKVQQRYFRGNGYVEVDVDIGSSTIAYNIMGTVRGFCKLVKVEYAIIFQGTTEDELPERVLACQIADKADYDHYKSINSEPESIS